MTTSEPSTCTSRNGTAHGSSAKNTARLGAALGHAVIGDDDHVDFVPCVVAHGEAQTPHRVID